MQESPILNRNNSFTLKILNSELKAFCDIFVKDVLEKEAAETTGKTETKEVCKDCENLFIVNFSLAAQ